MNVKAKGYVLGVIAAATYGMNPLFALPLYEAGMNPDSVLFFRYLFAIPVLGMMIKLRGRDFKLKRKEIFPLIIMGLLVALSSLTLFQSYNYMAAGIASTLLFVYPIMVALIMAFLFKEKLTLQTISDTFFVSKATLLYNFKKYTNCSLIDFLLNIRLTKAKEMLTKGAWSVNQIAERCGFSSANYFGLIFKQKEGISPLHYRKNQRAKQ